MSDRFLLYFGIPACTVIFMLLVGCGEPASCWSDQRATFRPCDEVRRDQINREIDKRQPAGKWLSDRSSTKRARRSRQAA